jgi:hypothetical protein
MCLYVCVCVCLCVFVFVMAGREQGTESDRVEDV